MQESVTRVLDRMRVLCSRREYCCADIRTKASAALVKQGMDKDQVPEAAKIILDSLVKDKYLDDLRYARAFVADKASIAGWGPGKIRYALIMKGIDTLIISEAISGADADKAGRRLYRLLETKWKSLSDDPAGKMKLCRFAMGRGYLYDDIMPVIEEIISGGR